MSLALLCAEEAVFFIAGQPDKTYHAFVGDTVILPCTITSPGGLSSSVLYWQIDKVLVHFLYKGKEPLESQDKRYHGRTSLFLDQMKHGNFSLKLSSVQLADTAVYSCIYRQTGDHSNRTQKFKIKLIVSGKIFFFFFFQSRVRELRAAFHVDKPYMAIGWVDLNF